MPIVLEQGRWVEANKRRESGFIETREELTE